MCLKNHIWIIMNTASVCTSFTMSTYLIALDIYPGMSYQVSNNTL